MIGQASDAPKCMYRNGTCVEHCARLDLQCGKTKIGKRQSYPELPIVYTKLKVCKPFLFIPSAHYYLQTQQYISKWTFYSKNFTVYFSQSKCSNITMITGAMWRTWIQRSFFYCSFIRCGNR